MAIHNSSSLVMVLAFISWSNEWVLMDTHMGLWPLAAIVALLAYYVLVHRLLAMRPAGTIVPRYQPPDNASPAMLRFLQRKTFDEKALAAAVLDLAARGYMEIRGGQREPYIFSRIHDDDSSLPPDEILLAATLFHDGAVMRIDLGHAEIVEHAKKTMAMCIESLAAPYFHSNKHSVGGGIALTFAALLALVVHTPLPGTVLFACVALALFGSIATTAWISAAHEIRRLLERRSAFGILMAVMETNNIIAPFVLSCFCALVMVFLARFVSIAFGVFLLAAVAINGTAFGRQRVLSRRGWQLLDEAEGFRQFLATAKADQLNRISDGVAVPEMICKVLPYAVAFDLEHRWASQRFAHAFGFAGGEYVSSKRVEAGNLLPEGMNLPNPFDLLSLASFLMEVDPPIKDALADVLGSRRT